MAETDQMTIDERRKYLDKMRVRCWRAKQKSEKTRLLDKMEAVTNLHQSSPPTRNPELD